MPIAADTTPDEIARFAEGFTANVVAQLKGQVLGRLDDDEKDQESIQREIQYVLDVEYAVCNTAAAKLIVIGSKFAGDAITAFGSEYSSMYGELDYSALAYRALERHIIEELQHEWE